MLVHIAILIVCCKSFLVVCFQLPRDYSALPEKQAVSRRISKYAEDTRCANSFYTAVNLDVTTVSSISPAQNFYRPVTLNTRQSGHAPSFINAGPDKEHVYPGPHHSLRIKTRGVNVIDLAEMLKKALPYLCPAEHAYLQRALAIALLVHVETAGTFEGRKRVEHAVRVCIILGELEMDIDVLLAALLTGTILPDGGKVGITSKDLARRFGKNVVSLVQSFEHTTRLEYLAQRYMAQRAVGSITNSEENLEQLDRLRNLILSEIADWRVVMLRVASHLQRMRHGGSTENQMILALEALNIHAPLAHRLGIHQLVSELQARAFKKLYPREYADLRRQIAARADVYDSVLNRAISDLTIALKANAAFMSHVESVELSGRTKEPYSMWRKMARQNIQISDVLDAVALRIIIKTRRLASESDYEFEERSSRLCYDAMEIVQNVYPTIAERFKDYVSSPKSNGYQSLHTTALMCDESLSLKKLHPFEVQVRTSEMHQQAEYGVAAHWGYKGEGSTELLREPTKQHSSIEEKKSDPVVFDGCTFVTWLSNELRARKVFVFGPDGLIWDMEKSATAADVARLVSIKNFYSRVRGSSKLKIMVEGNHVPFDYLLQNGDSISVIS